jgi:IMP dehydrogenase/GMP reductase
LTKNVTGVTVPQLEAIANCVTSVNGFNSSKRPLIVADGGIREYGDIAKAIGAGADLVMAGGIFSGADETPGDFINGKKVYRGMASRDAMRSIRVENTMPTPEGTSILVDNKGPVKNIVEDIAGALRSTLSYSNARNLGEFKAKVKFGIKRSICS